MPPQPKKKNPETKTTQNQNLRPTQQLKKKKKKTKTQIQKLKQESECKRKETNGAAIDGVPILEDTVKNRRVREDNKAKTTRATSGFLAHDNGLGDLTVLGEVLSQGFFAGVPCYASYE